MPSEIQNAKDSPAASKPSRFNIIPRNVWLYKTTIIKWGLVGYFIRIAMMPLFAHADLILNARMGAILYQNHQLLLSTYPPTVPLIFGSVYALFSPVLPASVLSGLTSNTSFLPTSLFSLYQLSQPDVMIFIFVSKIPYLVIDLALALLLLRIIDDEKKALLAFKLWIANPIAIFVSYAMGQFDIIPAFFLVLALYFFKERKELSSIASLGVCAAVKIFGLLFVPPMILIYLKEHTSLKSRAKRLSLMLIAGFLPLIISQIFAFLTPVYYESANTAWPYKSEVNGFFGKTFLSRGEQGNPLTLGLFHYALDYSISVSLGGNSETLYFLPLVYGLFLLGIFYVKSWSFSRFWKFSLVFLLTYYALAFFHSQWFVLVLPLLVLLVAEDYHRYFKLYLLLIPLFFILAWYWNDFLVSVFVPIVHGAYFWPGPHNLLNYFGLPVYPTLSIFRSIFSSLCIIFILLILRIDRLFLRDRNQTKSS
ncbi:MAG TPA: hypothetical protein VIH48_00880 [Candidatus Bathyarchaeia archaeon]